MHQRERIEVITQILKKNGYVTVKYLTEELHYSTATINRDLNFMKKQKLVKRSYGGVELIKSKATPLIFRYNKMRPAKNKIGKKAAEFICDGDTVFMDGSTTTQNIGKYITNKKNLTVITNNIALAGYLSEYNITVVCLGGRVVEAPAMLCSAETVENAFKYRADKMFFSVGSVTSDGRIGCSELYFLLFNVMRNNSDKVFLLLDHEKIDRAYTRIWGNLSSVDYVISDYCFSDELKSRFDGVNFVEVE